MISNIIFLVISLLVSGITWYLYAILRASGLRDRRMKGFGWLCITVPFWVILNAIGQVVIPEYYPAVYVLKSIPLNYIPYMSCWFFLHFSESKAAGTRFIRYFSIIMPSLAVVMLLTNPLHYKYLLSIANPPQLGPAFYAHLSGSVIYMMTVYIILFRYVVINYRKNPLLIVGGCGAAIPIVLYAVYLFMPNIIPYDLTSIGYFFTIVFVVYASYYSRLLSAKPGLLGDTLAGIAKSKEIAMGLTEEAARMITREACIALGAYRVRVWDYDAGTNILKSIASYSSHAESYTNQEDIDMKGIEGFSEYLMSERIIAINDVKTAMENGINPYDPEVCAVLLSPVLIDRKPIGVVCVEQDYNKDFPTKREWSPEEQSFVSSLADLMVLTVTNAERQSLIQRLETEQAALRESEENVQLLLDSAPLSVNLIDKKYNCVFVNQEAVRLYGLSSKEEYIKLFSSGNLSKEKGISHITKAYENGYNRCEMTFQNPDGEPLPCELTLVRVKYKGDYALAAYARDLREEKAAANKIRETEEKRLLSEKRRQMLESIARKEHEANQLKSRFLATMSHEIRTPMNAVIGMAELAQREENIDLKNEHIRTVKQAASTLLTIVNDILDFSKIEAGKLEIIPKDYSVSSMLNDVISIIKMRVDDLRIRFAIKVDSKIPRTLCGDEPKIRQALLNVLSNAVKYTEEGFVTFGVYADYVSSDTVNVTFEVTDTGIGIKPEDMERLFSGFIQFDLDKNRGTEGTGLGLAITHGIVKAMGGDISAQSKYNRGSTFTITIPQKYHLRDALAEVTQPEDKNILIYERRTAYADSIAYSLSNLGVECTLVTNTAGLIKKMKTLNFNYLFVPYTLLGEIEDTVSQHGKEIRIIILAGIDKAVARDYQDTLVMPAYCIQIADVLNNTYSSIDEANSEIVVEFTAPDAKVLIVDDIKTNLKVAQGLIEPYNMQVDLCNSGRAAIEAVASTQYDIIFMDHKMPGMDGVKATEHIRAMGEDNPHLKQLPIIALTANAVSGVREMFLENGFNDFLPKPIDIGRLNGILEKWIPAEKQVK